MLKILTRHTVLVQCTVVCPALFRPCSFNTLLNSVIFRLTANLGGSQKYYLGLPTERIIITYISLVFTRSCATKFPRSSDPCYI